MKAKHLQISSEDPTFSEKTYICINTYYVPTNDVATQDITVKLLSAQNQWDEIADVFVASRLAPEADTLIHATRKNPNSKTFKHLHSARQAKWSKNKDD